MTRIQYLDRLYGEGFRFKLLWQAQQTSHSGIEGNASGYAIYGSDGTLLTSIVMYEYDRDGLAVFFCSETLRIEDDIARLKDIAAARTVEVKAHG